MRHFQKPVFERAQVDDILAFTGRFKENGYAFIGITVSTVDEGCEVLYTFRAQELPAELVGRTVVVEPGQAVPSITRFYPEAFVFENEGHDLFGVDFEGINIDYDGDFYRVAVAYPMNPRAAMDSPDEDSCRMPASQKGDSAHE